MDRQDWREFLVSIGGEPLEGSGFETEQTVQDERYSAETTIVGLEEGQL